MILDVKRRRLIISDFLEYELTRKQVRLLLILCDNEFHNYNQIMEWCNLSNKIDLYHLVSRLRKRIKILNINIKICGGFILENVLLIQ